MSRSGVLALICAAVAALTLQLHADQAQAPPASGTGLVVGRVVDGTTNAPLGGVTVALALVRQLGPVIAQGSLPNVPRLVTGPDGVFVFRGLPKGEFDFAASASGYLPARAGMNRPDGRPLTVSLGEGEKVNDVVVRLWKASAVSGRVVDEYGDALEGMTIQLLRVERFGARKRFALQKTATTDDRGVYRHGAVLPGEYAVCAMFSRHVVPVAASLAQASGGQDMQKLMSGSGAMSASGSGYRVGDMILVSASGSRNVDPAPDQSGQLSVFADACHPGASSLAAADPVTIGYADDRTINLTVRLVPASTITGVVTGPDGPVGAGLGIHLFAASTDDTSVDSGVEAANTVTAPNGSFGFVGVPPGSYLVRATWVAQVQSDYPPELMAQFAAAGIEPPRETVREDAAKTRALWASQPVSLGAADAANVGLVLREGAQMSGRLVFEGAARQPDGAALARVMVTLDPAGGQLLERFAQARGAGSANGTFSVGNLFPGPYLVRAVSVPAGWRLKSALVGGTDAASDPIACDGSDLTGVVLTFTDRSNELAGIVRDDRGAPDAAASVIVFPSDPSRWLPFGVASPRLVSVRTTKAGAFSVQNLPPGDYFVSAVDDRQSVRWQDSATLTILARTAVRITMRDAEHHTQDLTTSRVR